MSRALGARAPGTPPPESPPAFALPLSTDVRPVPCDNNVLKVLSCIPVIGLMVGYYCESQIKGAILDSKYSSANVVACVQVKNHYKIANIIREVLCVAILVSLMASGVIADPSRIGLYTGISVVFAALAAFHGYCLHSNRQGIEKVKKAQYHTFY